MSSFGGVSVTAPAPAGGSKFGGIPVALAAPSGTSKFGGVAVESSAPAAPADPLTDWQKSYGEEMLDDFVSQPEGAWDQLKKDFVASVGGTGAEKRAWAQAPFWDQMKGEYKQTVAAGKLPLDAFNLAISPITGLMRAGIAKPAADAIHAALPGSEQMEKQGQVGGFKVTPAKEAIMEGISLAKPKAGPGAGPQFPEVLKPKAPDSTFSHIMKRPFTDPEEFAHGYIRRALNREGVTKEQAAKTLSKPGSALVDVGSEGTVEAGEQAALSGEGRRLGSKLFYDERLKGREARVKETVDSLASDKSYYDTLDQHLEARRDNADPLYEEAFSGGSHAALKTQFENEWNEASKAAQKARQEVQDADTAITMAKAKNFGSDNVYAASSHNEAVRAAESEKAAAEQKLAAAETKRDAAHDRLSTAQEHEKNGVKGGIWSERLQQFLNDSIVQQGIKTGMRTEQLRALAKGRAHNPHEWAQTSKDAQGDPVVSKVPNLRALDAGKRGMDEMLEQYRDKTTGKLVLDSRGRAIEEVRKAYVAELDRLTAETNPAYAKARGAWSGPSKIIDAVHKGREILDMDPEQIEKYVAGLSKEEHEGLKIGVVRQLTDLIHNSRSSTAGALSVAKMIAENTFTQSKLRAALKDNRAVTDLIEMAEREMDHSRRGGQVLGGSQTARRNAASKEFEQVGNAILDEARDAAETGLMGFATTPHRIGMRLGGRWIDRIIHGMSTDRREALAKLLFSTNHDDNMRALDMIYDEDAVTTPTGYPSSGTSPSKGTIPAAAAANQPQQQPQQ